MQEYRQMIQPELLILVPILNIIGSILKKTEWIRTKYIPLVLGGISILLSVAYGYGAFMAAQQHWTTFLFTSFTQGVLCAAASVYAHEIFKQNKK